MSFIYDIIDYLNDVSDFFYDIYIEILGWVWPFWQAADLFYGLCVLFNNLAWAFHDFADWLDWAHNEIRNILSWSDIRSEIRDWLDGIENLVEWFKNWADWINQAIDSWWDSAKQTVKDLIAIATQGLDNLLIAWDNFWTVTFPTLVSFTWLSIWWDNKLIELNLFIESTLATWSPFWEGWQEVRDSVTEFFTDPLQWLYDKMDEWFERFW